MLTHTTRQIIKFSLTGGINTAVDFGILNLLIYFYGLNEQDPKFFWFKATSAGVAILNSYLLNRLWVFRKRHLEENVAMEMSKFVSISIVGLLINATIASLVFNLTHDIFPETSPHILANLGALAATFVVMVFNFVSYKYLVFKK